MLYVDALLPSYNLLHIEYTGTYIFVPVLFVITNHKSLNHTNHHSQITQITQITQIFAEPKTQAELPIG